MSSVKAARKLYVIAGSLLILAIPYFIMVYGQNTSIERAQSLCPFKLLTGLPCPGCGITKSLIFLYEGQFSKSIYYHLFGPFTFLFCIIAIIVMTMELMTKKEFFRKVLYSQTLAYFLGISLAIYHLTRIIFFISTNNLDQILRQSIWK